MAEGIPQNKSQPWTVFDTVVADSFLLGDTTPRGLAKGTQTPAISASGEIVFFSSGRQQPAAPWYTNVQLNGQLAYGFEAWQAYLKFNFPPVVSWNSNSMDVTADATADQGGIPPALLLAHAILNFSVVEMRLGQEEQFSFPAARFAAGGGLSVAGGMFNPVVQNSQPQGANILKLPEPIEIPRTQPLDVKIKIAPEVRELIGTTAAPGVGAPLCTYEMAYCQEVPGGGDGDGGFQPTPISNGSSTAKFTSRRLKPPPWSLEFGLQGRRIKKTQYGQVPG